MFTGVNILLRLNKLVYYYWSLFYNLNWEVYYIYSEIIFIFSGSTFCDISDIKLFSLELYHHYLISSNIFNYSQKVLRSYFIFNYLKCISASDHDNFHCSQYSMLSGVPCVFAWMKDLFRYSVEIKFLPKNYCTFYGISKSDILGLL